MIRGVLAVVAGYALFTISAVLLFQLSGIDPHAPSSVGFRVFAIGYGAVFALGAGALVAVAARSPRPLGHVSVVAAIIALSSAISIVARPGEGETWTQLSALLLFAPMVIVGGLIAARRRSSGGV